MGAPGKWPGRVTCRAWHEQQDRDQDCYQDRRGSGWDPARAVSGVGGARRMPTLSSITFASRSLWWARLLNTPVTAAPPITPARPATASIHPERSAIAVSSPIRRGVRQVLPGFRRDGRSRRGFGGSPSITNRPRRPPQGGNRASNSRAYRPSIRPRFDDGQPSARLMNADCNSIGSVVRTERRSDRAESYPS
jgi:hypothetical protein